MSSIQSSVCKLTQDVFADEDTQSIRTWYRQQGWEPFQFQEDVWRACVQGKSGLLHAPTGTGKTLAAWFGALIHSRKTNGRGLQVLWITPLRALASDTANALEQPLSYLEQWLGTKWRVGLRTGDTSTADRRRLRANWPEALVTTPETLSILLSLENAHEIFCHLDTVIVDEWHELLSTKRGVQTELALARLKTLRPEIITWGLSATLPNLCEAVSALVGPSNAQTAQLIDSHIPRNIEIETLIPQPIERFPWAGHMGLRLLPEVINAIESARSSLVFTNTRSQAERWFEAIQSQRPEWKNSLALHHGSIDKKLREKSEHGLKRGTLKCVVATSSLDLGVDFGPVEQVFQIGSPKGIARLLQRAGRSGHAPGKTGRLICVPTHALELIECAAARRAAKTGSIEPRHPLIAPLDCLTQHIITVACSGGFYEDEILQEIRSTHAFARLDQESWNWAIDFAAHGGRALHAYPDYARIINRFGRWYVANKAIARKHRMNIGTIASDASVDVKWFRGGRLGTVEESFISRLHEGDHFFFAGRPLILFRFDGLTAWVKRARKATSMQVPRWNGGRMPLSTLLSSAVVDLISTKESNAVQALPPEAKAVRPLLQTQAQWSIIPDHESLLIEQWQGRDGFHTFIFPFEGRLVHEGLAALVAWRIANRRPTTLNLAATDWGFELSGRHPLHFDSHMWKQLFHPNNLLEDLLSCLNSTEMTRRHFREIARVAGLISATGRTTRQTQASAGLIYDVLLEHDGNNMLLSQARREVLEQQFEFQRLSSALESISSKQIRIMKTSHITPLAFPIWATLVQSRLSTHNWLDRITAMAQELECSASPSPRTSS